MTTINEWLEARIADVMTREGPQSLLTIGPDKPLGSQGYPTYADAYSAIQQVPPPAKGFRAYDTPWGCWVYMYDLNAMPALLDRNAPLLIEHGWPLDPGGFIDRIRGKIDEGNQVRPRTPLFDLISDAYGDKTNPGRTDCTVDPAVALTLFFKRTGTVDPVTLYYAHAGLKEARKLMDKVTTGMRRGGTGSTGGVT